MPWLNFDANFIFNSLAHLYCRFLLTSSQSLSGKQQKPSSSASRYISNSLSVYLFLDSEPNYGGIKVQVKRAFKSYLSPKNIRKKDRLWMKISSTSKLKCAEVPMLPISKLCPHFLLLHLFRRMSQSSGQDQQNGKQTYFQLTP